MTTCDFETFAINLFENNKTSSDEAIFRSCISRLYYAVYHRVLDWLKTHYESVYNQFGGGTHQRLQESCRELATVYKDRKFLTLHYKLKSLHDKRVVADYTLDKVQHQDHVELMLREIKQFHQAIDVIIQQHTPTYIYKSL